MKNDNHELRSENKYLRLLPGFILALLTAALLWRSQYGFIWSDEPYYYATAYRFMQGDIPVCNDWYTAQIYSVLLVPYMWIWHYMSGAGFTGLFMVSRIIYVGIQLVGAVICYRIIRKRSAAAALACSVIFLLYCRANIATLSYYAIGSFCLMISLMMVYHAVLNRTDDYVPYVKPGFRLKKRIILYWIFVGICWGISVICNPYMLAEYILIFCSGWFWLCRTHRSKSILIPVFMGIAVTGLLFICYILRRTDLQNIMTNVSFIMSDQSYYGDGFFKKVFLGIAYFANHYRYTIILSVLTVVYVLVKALRKKVLTGRERMICIVISTVVLAADLCYPEHTAFTTGEGLAAFAIWGVQIFFLQEKKDWSVFWIFYMTGLCTAVLMNASSDTRFSSMIQGCMVMSIGTVLVVSDWLERIRPEEQYGKLLKGILLGCTLLSIISLLYDRIGLVYRDKPLNQLTERIEQGPAKGILTTQECARRYNVISSTLEQLQNENGNLYIMNFCPWGYLYTEMKCSPYTTWRIMPDMDNDMGQKYYKQYPDKFPDIVFRLGYVNTEYKEDTDTSVPGDQAEYPADEIGENASQGLDGSWNKSTLVAEMKNRNYRTVHVRGGILYVKNIPEYADITEQTYGDRDKK